MDFALTEEQLVLQATADRLGREVYAPVAQEWDRNQTCLPDAERKRLADMGLLGIALPAEYGGGGGSLLDALVAIEALGKHNMVAGFQLFETNAGPVRVIDLCATPEQKERIIPSVVRGEITVALSISEPDAGSAATDLSTRGRMDGDHVVLNGTKRWCSGAGHAEKYLVYVRMSDDLGHQGIGAVLVDADADGITFGKREELMGFRGVASADIYLSDVRVPVEDVIVPPGGFGRLFSAFSVERLGNATMSLAMAQGALERTREYVVKRHQFGKPIIDFQANQISLADMVTAVDAARLLIWRAAVLAGSGTPPTLETSIAKCFANEAAKRVTDLAMQLHGGYGYSSDYHVERMHRDAHGWAIAGGTPSIQRTRIVAEYLGRRFDQRS